MRNKYQKILIASNNLGKIAEITSLLKSLNIEAISPLDFNLKEPIEDGNSFEENALIKAKFYAQ